MSSTKPRLSQSYWFQIPLLVMGTIQIGACGTSSSTSGGSTMDGGSSSGSSSGTTAGTSSGATAGSSGSSSGSGSGTTGGGSSSGTSSGTSSGPDASTGDSAAPAAVNVLEHHLHPQRDGAYVDAAITQAAAAKMVLDTGFSATITGIVYGQPLYVDALNKPGDQGAVDAVLVATDHNHVTMLNATTGAVLWDQNLGPFVPQPELPCGQPYPNYGITATPFIDLATRSIYVESFQTPDNGTTFKHYVYALSLDDGTTKAGWPVDIGAHVSSFNANHQHDRGALALLNGTLYVPYAGLNYDCDSLAEPYHGYVIGIDTTSEVVTTFVTQVDEGGIWGAVTTDGVSSVFAVTGNTKHPGAAWQGSEAILRFTAGPAFSGAQTDYFTPSNWLKLDGADNDLGSQPAVLFDLPGASPSTLAVVGGKAGVVHLVNRANLGGIGTGNGTTGEGLSSLSVSDGNLRGTPATYTSAMGRYYVVRSTSAMTGCPGATGGNMMALKVTAATPPALVPAWCADSGGLGSPIATTTDGTSNALVWIVSATTTNELLAFNGDTGAPVFPGKAGDLGSIQQSTSPIVAKGRFFIGGNGAVYAYKTM